MDNAARFVNRTCSCLSIRINGGARIILAFESIHLLASILEAECRNARDCIIGIILTRCVAHRLHNVRVFCVNILPRRDLNGVNCVSLYR